MSPFVQNLIAIGIGLLALTYLMRRWWPSAKALFQPDAVASGCGQTTMSQPGSAACGSCGQCGNATPRVVKDHRMNWVKQGRDASQQGCSPTYKGGAPPVLGITRTGLRS